MSGLDVKGLEAVNGALNDAERWACPEWMRAKIIRAYLASVTPADVGELVKRLRKHTESFGIYHEPRQVDVCLEAATALERVVRERDEALVERFDSSTIMMSLDNCPLRASKDGQWVRYIDYAALIAERDEARGMIEIIKKAHGVSIEAGNVLRSALSAAHNRIAEIEAATRERCAKVADAFALDLREGIGEAAYAASDAAEAIRNLEPRQ